MTGTLTTGKALLILVSLGVCHRLGLFVYYQELFFNQVSLNPKFLSMQFMSFDALGEHLWQSLKVMQLTPPLPNILVALGIKLFGQPHGLAGFLVLCQGVISILTSSMILLCLKRLGTKPAIALFIALVFLFGTDLLLMEYSVLGQAIHESLTMLLLVCLFYCWLGINKNSNRKHYLLIGILAGLLVMTRSYFFVFPIIFLVLLLLKTQSWKNLAWAFLPIIILHGGWSLKNTLAHDHFTLHTSTFSGFNLEHALSKTGHYDQFYPWVKDNDEHCPQWLQKATDETGLTFLWITKILPYAPGDLIEREKQRILELGGNPTDMINGETIRLVSNCYRKAWTGFALTHPRIMFDVFQQSFRRFWQPIRNYSRLYVSFFYPRNRMNFLGDPSINETDNSASINKVYIMQASLAKAPKDPQPVESTEVIPATTLTLSISGFIMLFMSFVTVNLVAPALIIYLWLKGGKEGRDKARTIAGFILVYWFCAVVTSIGEFGENTRFRLTIEPLIWVFTFYCWQIIFSQTRHKQTSPGEVVRH